MSNQIIHKPMHLFNIAGTISFAFATRNINSDKNVHILGHSVEHCSADEKMPYKSAMHVRIVSSAVIITARARPALFNYRD